MFVINLFAYVDDNFGFEMAGNLKWYEPYDQFMPSAQVTLLTLWDQLGVPHERHKQLWGEALTIIGFLVDINKMTLTLPIDSKEELITAIDDFLQTTSRRCSLAEWLQLAGWISWLLNVFLLLQPALCNVYLKTSGKEDKWCEIYVNKAVTEELSWFREHARRSSGVFFFKAIDWHPLDDTDFKIFTDACLEGMGFWAPCLQLGWYADVPFKTNGKIFFWEVVCVLSAIDWFCRKLLLHCCNSFPSDRIIRLTILTDNMNTVNIYDSLAALPGYNDLLRASVDLLIEHNVDLRVLHIPGDDNIIADLISRKKFDNAVRFIPSLQIFRFQPPQCVLGAAKK